MRKLTILMSIAILVLVAIGLAAITRQKSATTLQPEAQADSVKERTPGDAATPSPDSPGRWRPAREPGLGAELSAAEQERLKNLRANPYLSGYHKAPQRANVTLHDKPRAFAGLNLVVSGHDEEASVMDMEGKVLHTWRYGGARELWPRVRAMEPMSHWRRVHLYANGDVLVIYEGIGMIKLDRDSRLLWHVSGGSHHDMDVIADGRIFVLTRKPSIIPGVNGGKPVLEDFITILGPDGAFVETHSLVGLFMRSPCRDTPVPQRRDGDIFHTNTIQVFDGRHSAVDDIFRKGNVLVSILHIDMLAIVDLRKRAIVWAANGQKNGQWHHQHEPVMLDNGNVLLFDNNRRLGASKILEFEPLTGKEVWSYRGTEADPFYSKTCGTSQRLPNDNTLITESDYGRAFEVTRDGEKVWEYVNPHRTGENNELIATLLEVVRIAPKDVGWLK